MDMPHTVDVMTATIPETHRLTGQMIIAGTPVRGTGTQIHAFDPAATRRYAIWEDREGIREPAALQKRLDATTPQGAPVASLTGAKGSTPRLCTPAWAAGWRLDGWLPLTY